VNLYQSVYPFVLVPTLPRINLPFNNVCIVLIFTLLATVNVNVDLLCVEELDFLFVVLLNVILLPPVVLFK